MPTKPVNSSFVSIFPLFEFAKFGLLLIVLIQSSILSCIDNVYLFHSLFLFHIFLVPIQYHCYIAIIEPNHAAGVKLIFLILTIASAGILFYYVTAALKMSKRKPYG